MFSYGGKGHSSSISCFVSAYGEDLTNRAYLPFNGVEASESNKVPLNIAEWTTGAVSDFDGVSNTDYLKTMNNNGTYVSENYTPVGILLSCFLNSSDAIGYTNWIVPTAGQFALIYMYLNQVNTVMESIGGKPIDDDWTMTQDGLFIELPIYLTSTLADFDNSWGICTELGSGYLQPCERGGTARVRLIRDLE